ncbi:MAG: hypothetical protein BM557_09520 [Flavobacterium sp. MedPE-SWcel]|uniref:hypothetical protein n=1 Tax=uncultured Flavobacterium sp. TaxID=165435 RepID=UPI0009160321|nr:hypothetical protein [uncultured Flavobacterium sp.]OIQ16543.1 MAG: hypothetical protein BM557_09520 [Flavobacterium sp. MedPE-SWcel]
MERNIGKITLYERLDKGKLQTWLATGDILLLDVERRYVLADLPDTLPAVLPTQFTDPDYMDALFNAIDAAAFVHEQGCYVFKVAYDSGVKEFDLRSSYVRNDIDSTTGDAVPNGIVIKAVFNTPSFPENIKTVISLPYGQPISNEDVTALRAVGLLLNNGSTGSQFSFKQTTVPYTVKFYQPNDSAVNYVIDFDLTDKVIEK